MNVVKGLKDATLDWKNLVTARDDLITKGGGEIGIDGNVCVNSWLRFPEGMSISLVAASHDAMLTATSSKACLTWGANYDPLKDPWAAPFPGCNAGAYEIESPSLLLAPGDWFLVWSDDMLQGLQTHFAGGYQCPMELHQVKELRGTKIVFDDIILDAMTVNPKIAKLTTAQGVRLKGLKLAYTDTLENTRFLDFRQVAGLKIEDCHIVHGGPGPCVVNNCARVDIAGFNCDGKQNYDQAFGYHVIAGLVNGMHFRHSLVAGTRHAFTTSGISQGTLGGGSVVNTRWGTPRNIIVESVIAKGNGWPPTAIRPAGAGLIPFDCHSEGRGIKFANCRAIVPADTVNCGFNTRARDTQLIDCEVIGGGSNTRGIWIKASGCRVQGGFVDNCREGIVIEAAGATVYDCVIRDFDITRCHYAGIQATKTQRLKVSSVDISGSAYSGLTKSSRALISLKDTADTNVFHSTLRKERNEVSVTTTGQCAFTRLDGNVMSGYGPGTNGTSPLLTGDNFTD